MSSRPPSPALHRKAMLRAIRAVVAYRLRSARASLTQADGRSVTQRDMATRLGRPQSYVQAIESGGRRLDVGELIAIGEAYAIKPNELLAPAGSDRERALYAARCALAVSSRIE